MCIAAARSRCLLHYSPCLLSADLEKAEQSEHALRGDMVVMGMIAGDGVVAVMEVEMKDADAEIADEHSITDTNMLKISQRIRQLPDS